MAKQLVTYLTYINICPKTMILFRDGFLALISIILRKHVIQKMKKQSFENLASKIYFLLTYMEKKVL